MRIVVYIAPKSWRVIAYSLPCGTTTENYMQYSLDSIHPLRHSRPKLSRTAPQLLFQPSPHSTTGLSIHINRIQQRHLTPPLSAKIDCSQSPVAKKLGKQVFHSVLWRLVDNRVWRYIVLGDFPLESLPLVSFGDLTLLGGWREEKFLP